MVEEALNRETTAYDSHPTPAARFALVDALHHRSSAPQPDDDIPVWSLFSNPEELQHAMTAEVRENVRRNYGVEIAAPES